MVTGSARLDLYRRGGDSLQGRYHFLRLHPLTLDELGSTSKSDYDALFRLGCFPELVGSPLSIKRISEDIQKSPKTIQRWVRLFENFYAIYLLAPFGSPKVKAVKKERKHYHFDWTLIKEPGLRFENMVANHLLKWTHFYGDTQGRDIELLFYIKFLKRKFPEAHAFQILHEGNADYVNEDGIRVGPAFKLPWEIKNLIS